MADRIDHAAEARKAIEYAYPIVLPYDSAEAQYHGALMEAQVHATLALVEQQRIANLIAVATWNANTLRTGGSRDGKPADREVENARVDRLFSEIREGLGL